MVLFEYQNQVISYFTADADLGYLISSLIPMLGIGNIINVIGSNAYAILTSQSRAKLVTFIWMCCAWLIGVPVAIYFVVAQNYGLQPLLWSILMGYATASIVILFIVFASNWEKLSKQIRAKSDKVSGIVTPKKTTTDEPEWRRPIVSNTFGAERKEILRPISSSRFVPIENAAAKEELLQPRSSPHEAATESIDIEVNIATS